MEKNQESETMGAFRECLAESVKQSEAIKRKTGEGLALQVRIVDGYHERRNGFGIMYEFNAHELLKGLNKI